MKTKFSLNFDVIDRAETHAVQRRLGLDANPDGWDTIERKRSGRMIQAGAGLH